MKSIGFGGIHNDADRERAVFSLSLSTMIEAAPLLAHNLEDRASIRAQQDPDLLQFVQTQSTTPLRSSSQEALFAVAPIDILMCQKDGRPQFHMIELNGSGIGGLTNMGADAVAAVLKTMSEIPLRLTDQNPLIVIASSGKENDDTPRLNGLIYEKLLYADAIRATLVETHGGAKVYTTNDMSDLGVQLAAPAPAIVVGYMKDFLRTLAVDQQGAIRLFGRKVNALINDRFILNVIKHFDGAVDLSQVATMNRTYLPGADKAVAYELMNGYLQTQSFRHLPNGVIFKKAFDRDELIAHIQDFLALGRQVVIKPQGTGLGHGIEFFLDRTELTADIAARVDHSLQVTEHYYGLQGGAFPYTVTEFIDTSIIHDPSHHLHGRKFELRVVVYRDGATLKAFPSIAKVASQVFDSAHIDRMMLINNITASKSASNADGKEFMLPLCHAGTLRLLGIDIESLAELCKAMTGYVRFVLDQLEDAPAYFSGTSQPPVATEASADLTEPTLRLIV